MLMAEQRIFPKAELNIIDKNQDSLAGRMAYLTIDNTKVVVTTKFWKIHRR